MNKVLSSLLVATLLTACGGGGGDSTAPSGPVAAAPAPAAATTTPTTPAATTPTAPAATSPTVSEAPPAPAGMTISAGSSNTTSTGKDYLINFNGMTNMTLNGNLNRAWVSAAQAGGSLIVNGESNTVVLKPSATPTTVTVIGPNNTFYLPEGSSIKLEGPGAAQSTVKYYKA